MLGSDTTTGDTPTHESQASVAQPQAARHVPMTEEQIQAVHIGVLTPLTHPIQLADYDPEWPHLFAREAARVQATLGERVLVLEHIGSTSVPELAAKPIIDMLLVVANSADEPAYVPDLEAAGYVLRVREPNWYEHRLFKGPDTDINVLGPQHDDAHPCCVQGVCRQTG
jgi:GrpB-like predicted nucleotidyltransferase (UPF0157 family)